MAAVLTMTEGSAGVVGVEGMSLGKYRGCTRVVGLEGMLLSLYKGCSRVVEVEGRVVGINKGGCSAAAVGMGADSSAERDEARSWASQACPEEPTCITKGVVPVG